MPKRILLSFITLLVLFCSLSGFQLKAKGNSYSGKTTVETQFLYNRFLTNNLAFDHSIESIISHDDKFARTNKNNKLNWLFSLNKKYFDYRLKFNYQYIYDKANLDNSAYKLWQRKRSAGLGINYKLGKNHSVNTDFDYYYNRENDRTGNSLQYLNKGYSGALSTNSSFNIFNSKIKLRPYYNIHKLSYENKNELGTNINYEWQTQEQILKADFDINRFSDDIYAYQKWDDKQIKNTRRLNAKYTSKLYNKYNFYTEYTNFYESNDFEDDKFKQYTLNKNISYSSLSSNYGNFWLKFAFKISDSDKDYFEKINTRKVEEKLFASTLSYNFFKTDSIVFNYETNLIKTVFPDKANVLDNDRLTNHYSLAWYIYLRSKLLFVNYFAFNQNHDVYILPEMSANNIKKHIFNLRPAVYASFGNLQVYQKYDLRADYDRWDFSVINNSKRNDKIYRKFAADYKWLYIPKSPVYATEETFSQFYLDTLNWYLSLNYRYDTNEFGDEIDGLYSKNVVNKYHKLELDYQVKFDKIILRFNPRADWTQVRQFSHLLELKYILSPNKKATLGFNPDGTTFDDINWRFYCQLNYSF